MSIGNQIVDEDRYKTIPRTLVFLLREEQVLMIEYGEGKGPWAGMLNGIGGHIERGEDPLQAARREIGEEVGLEPIDLRLCGSLFVATGSEIGISLFVFVGLCPATEPSSSGEGQPRWIAREELSAQRTIADVPQILELALESYANGRPFSASSSSDDSDQHIIRVSE
jgi:8-oxo-dGTP diphosphatase